MSDENFDSALPAIPHIEQYLGLWAMYQDSLLAGISQINSLDIFAHIAESQAKVGSGNGATGGRELYSVTPEGVAVVPFVGAMTKYSSSLASFPGTVQMRRVMRELSSREDVKSVAIKIDSPGGSVSGVGDLADDVRALAAIKPVVAYIEDLGASAAYIVASQCTKIVAGTDSVVGSIGMYAVVYDYSGLFAKEGVKPHVVRAGAFKGVGVQGTEITADQIAEMQRTIHQANEMFLGRVSRGRRMTAEQVAALADGRVHVGEYARALGLVDEIKSFDAVLADLTVTNNSKRGAARAKEVRAMANGENIAASAAELKAGCPGSTADFRLSCIEADKSLADAKDGWMAELVKVNEVQAKQITDLRGEVTDLRGKLAEAEAKVAAIQSSSQTKQAESASGVEPLGGKVKKAAATANAEGGATEQWNAAVAAKVAGGLSRGDALFTVAREQKELHAAYVEEFNAARKDR